MKIDLNELNLSIAMGAETLQQIGVVCFAPDVLKALKSRPDSRTTKEAIMHEINTQLIKNGMHVALKKLVQAGKVEKTPCKTFKPLNTKTLLEIIDFKKKQEATIFSTFKYFAKMHDLTNSNGEICPIESKSDYIRLIKSCIQYERFMRGLIHAPRGKFRTEKGDYYYQHGLFLMYHFFHPPHAIYQNLVISFPIDSISFDHWKGEKMFDMNQGFDQFMSKIKMFDQMKQNKIEEYLASLDQGV